MVEWAVNSIQAYKDAHCYNDNTNYSESLNKQELIDYLYNKGISSNYNEPMTYDQIKRKNEDWLRQVYNNIIATKNIVDITKTKASDLEIVDTDKYEYIMTYSFPCQDLSLAGLGKGMARDSGTRSGMLWEVERILDECENLPQILLMENVPEVKGTKNVKYFNEWQHKLESLGYKNYHQNLIATDYGIPQTRNRTFMVSILGDYSYTFPQPIPLKLKLKDMLEDNVDEKYYLSSKQLEQISNWNAYQNPFDTIDKENCPTLTTRSGAFAAGMVLTKDDDRLINNPLKDKTPYGWHFEQNIFSEDSCVRTLKASEGSGNKLKVVENSNNLKTQLCNTLIEKGIVKENDVIKHSYTSNKLDDERLVPNHNISPTLDTRCDCLGVVVGTYQYSKNDNFMQGKPRFQQNKNTADTLQTTPKEGVVYISNNIYNLFFTIFDLCGIIDIKEIDKYERSKPLLSILWREITKEEIWEEIRRFYSIQKKNILQQTMYEDGLFENRKFQSRLQNGTPNSKKYNEEHKIGKEMFNLWEKWKNGYTPQRWELSEQQFEQFNVFMQKLPHETTSDKIYMQDMWQTNEGFRVLQQTLLEIQEIWRPTKNQISNGLRIRKLSTREVFRLMGVKDEDYERIAKNQSNSSLYHLAGDSIVVNVLMAIFEQLLNK